MAKEMLINTVAGQETRIAIVRDGKLVELYVERTSRASHVGNIYKGRVVNVEPSIQAAFIDFGLSKHGFLHISDVQPQYFPSNKRKAAENVGSKRPHYQRPPIQECLRKGQELVVQMTKEGIGTKGPTMTTYLSLPGRLVVMMPGLSRLGISRKVEDEEARDKTRAALKKLKLPANMGFIVRTAGVGRSTRDLQRDLNYLTRLWKIIKKHIASSAAPALIYQESNLVIRTTRDIYNRDIDRIICDDKKTAREVREFLKVATPRTKHRIDLYTGKEGLFHDYGLESEIENIYARRVQLDSGGSLVIDQTEALVAIDVNTGRFREHADPETTALKTNQSAAKEIARQLRLRDLGGVIVIDFIDMRERKNRSAVERTLREAMKVDRAKSRILHMNTFGTIQMTRQRVGPSLRDNIYETCSHCAGAGLIKSHESQSLLVMRALQRATSNEDVARVDLSVTPDVEHHLSNYQRKQLSELESATGKTILVRSDPELTGDEMRIKCTNARGSDVAWEQNRLAEHGKVEAQTIRLETFEAQQLKDQRPKPAEGERTGAEKPTPSPPEPKTKAPRRKTRRSGKRKKEGKPADTGEEKPPPETRKKTETSKARSSSGKPRSKRGKRGGRKRRTKSSRKSET